MRSPAVYSLKFGLVLKRPDQRSSHSKRLMSLACASTEPAPDFGPTTLIISVGCSFDEGVTRVANLAWHCQFNFISIHCLRSERGAFPPVHLDPSPLHSHLYHLLQRTRGVRELVMLECSLLLARRSNLLLEEASSMRGHELALECTKSVARSLQEYVPVAHACIV
jgi:hypothetical protein